MKKRLTLAVAALLSMLNASAQMSAYGLEVTTSPMEFLTGANVIDIDFTDSEMLGENFAHQVIDADGTAIFSAVEDAPGIPIGFDFKFGGQNMTQFLFGTCGDIYLFPEGDCNMQRADHWSMFDKTYPYTIGAVTINGFLGAEGTELSYKTEGEEGHRVLCIQYKNANVSERAFWSDPVAIAVVNVQYRLYEENGNVEIKLSGYKPLEDANMQYQSMKIGLHASDDDRIMLADFAGQATTTRSQLINYTVSSYPADGTTYLFKAPEPCVTPTVAAKDLVLSATTQSIGGQFTVGDADHYMVLVSKNAELSEMPQDKQVYAVDAELGGATIVATPSVSAPWFSTSNIFEASSEYNVFIIGYNSQCIDGPLYNTTGILTGKVKTMAGAPKTLTMADADLNSITVAVEADPDAEAIVLMTDRQQENNWGDKTGQPIFGTPSGKLSVGDVLENGEKVVYIGNTTDGFTVSDLAEASAYFFRAYSTDGNGNYSSTYTDLVASTALTLPWQLDINSIPRTGLPLGWTAGSEDEIWSGDTRNGVFYNQINEVAEEGTVNTVISPFFFLAENANRLKMRLATAGTSWRNDGEWLDNDTVKVQMTKDGSSFTDVLVVTKDQNITASMQDLSSVFYENAGEKVRFRIYVNRHGEAKTQIGMFMLEQKPDCDYPVGLAVSEISGTQAVIRWTPQGEEDAWQVAVKKADAEEWGEPVTVRETSYTAEELDNQTVYEVRVRAYCSATSQSPWSETASFKTAVGVPFEIASTNNTDDLVGWASYEGKLGEELTEGGDFGLSGYYGLYFGGYTGYGYDCWYVSPLLDLGDDATQSYIYSNTFGMGYESSYSTYLSEGQKVMFAVSRDGKPLFNEDDVFFTLDQSEFPAANESGAMEGKFVGYTGKVRLGIYITAPEVAGERPRDISFLSLKLALGEKDPSVGIESAQQLSGSNSTAIYNEAGQPVNALKRGVNIVRKADGTVKKVVMK